MPKRDVLQNIPSIQCLRKWCVTILSWMRLLIPGSRNVNGWLDELAWVCEWGWCVGEWGCVGWVGCVGLMRGWVGCGGLILGGWFLGVSGGLILGGCVVSGGVCGEWGCVWVDARVSGGEWGRLPGNYQATVVCAVLHWVMEANGWEDAFIWLTILPFLGYREMSGILIFE